VVVLACIVVKSHGGGANAAQPRATAAVAVSHLVAAPDGSGALQALPSCAHYKHRSVAFASHSWREGSRGDGGVRDVIWRSKTMTRGGVIVATGLG
jgi:hypothetical protein